VQKVVKGSTVSTGNLKLFPTLQLQPINPVVFRGSLEGRTLMESKSWHRLHA